MGFFGSFGSFGLTFYDVCGNMVADLFEKGLLWCGLIF
jgi:hypothetical protein